MKIEDVTNIDNLITFMDDEASKWGRKESDQKTVNGAGITKQWNKENKTFPYEIFYLRYTKKLRQLDGTMACSFNIEQMWFDEEGNKTDRPN